MSETTTVPKVLHRDVFPGGGPYVEFLSHERPLFHPFDPPGLRHERGPEYGLFFEFGDDLLDAICSATKQRSPFSPWDNTYYVPNLKRFRELAKAEDISVERGGTSIQELGVDYGPLSELRGGVEDWRRQIARMPGWALRWMFKFHSDSCSSAKVLRADLIAIRSFAVGRHNWLFADTTRSAYASAACYSLIGAARANQLEPAAYIDHVFSRIGDAETPEQVETQLPWNLPLARIAKKRNLARRASGSI